MCAFAFVIASWDGETYNKTSKKQGQTSVSATLLHESSQKTVLFLVTFRDATLVQALGHWASKLPLRLKKNATCFHSYKNRVDVLTCCIF